VERSITVKLYLLTRPPGDVDYDEAAGFLVLAETPWHARRVVAAAAEAGHGPGDEGGSVWMSKTASYCLRVAAEADLSGEPRILLRDFRAG
jgi:hypothetical protein